jgi:hypothetical protein
MQTKAVSCVRSRQEPPSSLTSLNFSHDLIIQEEMFPSVSDFKKPGTNQVGRDEGAESDPEDNDDYEVARIIQDTIIVEQPPEVYATIDLVHSDLAESNITSLGGGKYVIS